MIGYREKVEWTKREVVSNPSRCGELVKREGQTDLDLTGSPLGAGFDANQEWNLSSSELVGEEVVGEKAKGRGLSVTAGYRGSPGPSSGWFVASLPAP